MEVADRYLECCSRNFAPVAEEIAGLFGNGNELKALLADVLKRSARWSCFLSPTSVRIRVTLDKVTWCEIRSGTSIIRSGKAELRQPLVDAGGRRSGHDDATGQEGTVRAGGCPGTAWETYPRVLFPPVLENPNAEVCEHRTW